MLILKDTSKKRNENYTQRANLRALDMDYYVLLQYKGRDLFFFSCELKKGLYYAKLIRYLPNPLEGSMT